MMPANVGALAMRNAPPTERLAKIEVKLEEDVLIFFEERRWDIGWRHPRLSLNIDWLAIDSRSEVSLEVIRKIVLDDFATHRAATKPLIAIGVTAIVPAG